MGEASHIKVLTIHWRVVELEITGEDHRAHRCGDRQRKAVGHRVGVADELHREMLAHLHHIARCDRLQRGAVGDARLIHLSGEHRQGQSGPIDHRDVEVLEVMGNPTDVVFMAMGHDHPANAFLVLTQKAGIGQNHVHTMHSVTGKRQSGIHQHQVVAVLEHAGVFADLMQTTQGDHP